MNQRIQSFLVLALIVAAPFEYIPTHDVGGFTLKISYLLGVALIGTFLVTLLQNWKKVSMNSIAKLAKQESLLVVLFSVALLSLAVSHLALRSAVLTAMWGFVFLIHVLVFQVLKKDVVLRKKAFQLLLWVGILTSIFGIYQVVADGLGVGLQFTLLRQQYSHAALGFARAQSVALEPLYFANFLFWPLFAAVGLQLEEKKVRALTGAMLFFGSTALMLGIARGAYLAFVVAVAAVVVVLAWKKLLKGRGRLILEQAAIVFMSLVVGFMIVGVSSFENGASLQSSFIEHATVQSDSRVTVSVPTRLEAARLAMHQFTDSPLIGFGVGSFGLRTSSSDLSNGYGIVNNQYLEILAELGLLGFVVYLLWVFGFLRSWLTTPRGSVLVLALGGALVAHLVQELTFSTLYIMPFWVYLALWRAERSASS